MTWIDSDLVMPDLSATTNRDVLYSLGERLLQAGRVRPSFAEALWEREQKHPTGIATPSIGVAIPHADPEHVLSPSIAVAKLAAPVPFRAMDDPNKEVSVQLVFCLALADAESHMQLLQSLAGVFLDAERLAQLSEASTRDVLVSSLTELLGRREGG